MGMIRKTIGYSSFGLVNPHTPKERERLANAKLAKEQAKLAKAQREQLAR